MKGWSFIKHADAADMTAVEMLQWVLACLRAQYWNYQESHWQTRGGHFYGNHLLFERLYGSVTDHTDTLAEKMVGSYGAGAVDGLDLGAKFESFIKRWHEVDCLHRRGLMSEQDLQDVTKSVYEALGDMGELSLGMDDFLMAMANDHETNIYLLRQTLRNKEAAMAAAPEWTELSKKE